MKKTIFAILLLISMLAVSCGPSAPTPLPNPTPVPTPVPDVLFVDPGVDLGPVSPYLLGSNYGPWVAVPVDMLDAAYASKVTVIRFPGGAWGDRNVLKSYQIDPFMAFCDKIGAIPTISVNLRDGTPEQAAELVRYVNIEKKYGVVYWAIGNEPTLFAQETGDSYDTVRFNTDWRKFAEAMRAVDPSIKFIGPEIHQYAVEPEARPKDENGLDWMDEFLKENGDMVDVVSFHRYPFGRTLVIDDLRQNVREWDDLVIALRERIHELTGRDIPMAITEVNTNYNPTVGGEATPDSLFGALWLADIVGQMARQGLFMFNHWMLTSSGSGQGGWGLIGRGELRPSYYVYQLYSMFGSELVYAASGIEDVNIYAAKRADGTLTLMVVNLTNSEQTIPLQVSGQTPSTTQVWRLDAEHSGDNLGELSIPAESMFTLPMQSLSLFVIAP